MDGDADKAYIVSTINDWFDVCDSRNGYHKSGNENKSGLGVYCEKQEESLRRMQALTESMVVGPSKKMKNARREMLPFQRGILCSINAVRALWAELKEEGFDWLATKNLNQDLLENFFSAIRGLSCMDTNPNPVQFCTRLRILKMKSDVDVIRTLTHGSQTSVELSIEDDEDLLEPLVASELGRKKLIKSSTSFCLFFLLKLALPDELEDEIELEVFTNPSLSDEGAIEYIAGYITHKVHIVYNLYMLQAGNFILVYSSLDIPEYNPLAIQLSRAMEACVELQWRW